MTRAAYGVGPAAAVLRPRVRPAPAVRPAASKPLRGFNAVLGRALAGTPPRPAASAPPGRPTAAPAPGAAAAPAPGSGVGAAAALGGGPPPAAPTPLRLEDFPRPPGDNGWGIHWIPTLRQPPEVVDRFVREAKEMGIKWVVFLNDDAKVGDNDYLVKRLVENGIMPIMRIYTPNGRPIQGDLAALVRHYTRLGVYYYQLYNEPNLNVENPEGRPDIDRYLDRWVPAARIVAANGGYPGFGALAPGGNMDDLEFLRIALERLIARGEVDALDRAWLSMHNYMFNHPLDYAEDSNGYLKFRWYDRIVREKLGRPMPIIGTEGGAYPGAHEDRRFPPLSPEEQVRRVVDAYRYMDRREPYYFAFSYWVIANEEGGGYDRAFTDHALFRPGGRVSPIVSALKTLAGAARGKEVKH